VTMQMKQFLSVAAGGALGAAARYGIKLAPIFRNQWDFPFQTLSVNLAGSFLIAFFLTAAERCRHMDPVLRAGVVGGFLGAFTTFSTYCRESWQLLSGHDFLPGLIYLVASPLFGLAAILLGTHVAGSVFPARNGTQSHKHQSPCGPSGKTGGQA